MQDEWVGDKGDFLKLGLLRHVIQHGGDLVNPLGVNWYFGVPETTEDPDRQFDPELFDALGNLKVTPNRSVAKLQQAGLLDGAIYFDEPMEYTGRRYREDRLRWHDRARATLVACPTVFLDPDNGMEPDIVRSKSYTKARLPHVFWSELRDYYEDGKTVIVFQHARREKIAEQDIAGQVKQALGLEKLPMSVRRGQRWMYVIPKPTAWSRFEKMIGTFRTGGYWNREWPDGRQAFQCSATEHILRSRRQACANITSAAAGRIMDAVVDHGDGLLDGHLHRQGLRRLGRGCSCTRRHRDGVRRSGGRQERSGRHHSPELHRTQRAPRLNVRSGGPVPEPLGLADGNSVAAFRGPVSTPRHAKPPLPSPTDEHHQPSKPPDHLLVRRPAHVGPTSPPFDPGHAVGVFDDNYTGMTGL